VVSEIRRVSCLLLRVGYLGIGMNRLLLIPGMRRKLGRFDKVWWMSGSWVWARISNLSRRRSHSRERSDQVVVNRRC
jgi:hypothetical protein